MIEQEAGWVGFMVTDRAGCPCAWVSFEKDFGWSVYAFGLFRRCVPMHNKEEWRGPYTAMNHGLSYGGKLPSDPFALPEAVGTIRWGGGR